MARRLTAEHRESPGLTGHNHQMPGYPREAYERDIVEAGRREPMQFKGALDQDTVKRGGKTRNSRVGHLRGA